MIVIW